MQTDKTIDGTTYRVAPLPAGKGFALLTMISKVIGPALVAAPSLADVKGGEGVLLRDAFGQLEEKHTERLYKEMAAATLVETAPGSGNFVLLSGVFDVHFAGRFGALVAWLAFTIEVNYAGFFDAVRALMPTPPPAPAPEAAPSAA